MSAKVLFIPHGGGGGGGGEVNEGANVGTGPGKVYKDKTGATLNFRTLESQDGSLNITPTLPADFTVNLEVATNPYAFIGWRGWDPPGSWTLPLALDPPVVPPNNLQTVAAPGALNDFTLLGGGLGGRVRYTGTQTRSFRIGITATTVRPVFSIFDAIASFYVGVNTGGGFSQISQSIQRERYNLVEADVVVHVEAIAELDPNDEVALMVGSNAAPAIGLALRLDGYTLVVTSV
ncbi:MAG: hypothetical protein GY772_29530 [bacterium]|nr:hypothetical protein [bacterium]